MTENSQSKNPTDAGKIYHGFREMMLKIRRPPTIPNPAKPTEPWGVLMDWGMRNGTATVMSMADGSASVYLSSGGGYIGGQGIEKVRLAAQQAIAQARSIPMPEQPMTDFPLPEPHGMIFHFLSDAGVFTLRSSEQELNSPTHALRKLGDAMQAVITEFRIWRANAKTRADKTMSS